MTIELGDRSYEVVVGHGVLDSVRKMVPPSAKRIAVVTQDGVPEDLIPTFDGVDPVVLRIGRGEAHKTLSTVETLCRGFAMSGLTRADAIVGVGGGMVTDVAGFAAAVYHRGIAVVHVPTTLLAMIDASVGGKTGVNLVEGKNLVGAFWQPTGVVCELDALESLPEREVRCGYGEMAKYHFIARENLAVLSLEQRIVRSIAIKGAIVAEDEREGGRRALLNYGHTLGHALETATDFRLAHGEAVSVGILYAAELAALMGRIDDARVDEHYEVVNGLYGLRVAIPESVTIDRLILEMARDKKAIAGHTFVLDGADGLDVVSGVAEDDMREAFSRLRRRAG